MGTKSHTRKKNKRERYSYHPKGGGKIGEYAYVSNYAYVSSKSKVVGGAHIFGPAFVNGSCLIKDAAQIFDQITLDGDVTVSGRARISGNAYIKGKIDISYGASISGNTYLEGEFSVGGETEISGNAKIRNASCLALRQMRFCGDTKIRWFHPPVDGDPWMDFLDMEGETEDPHVLMLWDEESDIPTFVNHLSLFEYKRPPVTEDLSLALLFPCSSLGKIMRILPHLTDGHEYPSLEIKTMPFSVARTLHV